MWSVLIVLVVSTARLKIRLNERWSDIKERGDVWLKHTVERETEPVSKI